jgi:predicted kinase
MAIRATISSVPKNRITINNLAGQGAAAIEFRQLKDVNATNLTDGNTVVYDKTSDKFVVEELPRLNGGSF